MKCSIYYKIGFSKNPNNRLRTVKTHNPLDVFLIAKLKTDNYAILEKELHKKFINKNSRREWFELNEDDLLSLKIDYGFSFSKSISNIIIDSGLNKKSLNEVKNIRIDNNKIDYLSNYFESLYDVTIHDLRPLKKCCIKYDSDIIRKAIDSLYGQDLEPSNAYRLLSKVCSNIVDIAKDPTSHVLKIINAIMYKQYHRSSLSNDEVEEFIAGYDISLDHEDVVKTLNTKKFYLKKYDFVRFVFDRFIIKNNY